MSIVSVGSYVVPGDVVAPDASASGGVGSGLAERGGRLHVTKCGLLTLQPAKDAAARPVLTVVRHGETVSGSAVVPAVGSVVQARVVRLNLSSAAADIVVVDGRPLAEPFTGVIRRENVRDTEIDKVVLPDCFQPGDIVKAVIVSLGDARSYFLSTSGPDLGVVYARTETGELLVPVSGEEMEAASTGVRVKRKVARPEL